MTDTPTSSIFVLVVCSLFSLYAALVFGKLIVHIGIRNNFFRPILISLLWSCFVMPPSLCFALFFDYSIISEFLFLPLLAAILGLAYGFLSYLSHFIIKNMGGWLPRIFTGAALGGFLAITAGITLHLVCANGCWGGPGGGGQRNDSIIMAILIFWWLAPLSAIAGLITPMRAVMPESVLTRDTSDRRPV